MLAWTLFYNPVPMPSTWSFWLLLPLCLSIVVVYRTIRTKDMRRLPMEILRLSIYMAAGLSILGLALWLLRYCM
ncbi:MAG: hypothetical protein HZA50_04575 [Planctomycetes bacterium]|nr:hypothetical protein [Planctomycetota bacterium]